jgi:cardiolipin synthase
MRVREQAWWIRTFFGLGVLATLGTIVTLFFALGRRPPHMWASATPPVDSREFLAAIAGGVGSSVKTGGEVRLLSNGDAFFPRLLEDLQSARHTIHFSVYIWEKGRLSAEISKVLAQRARAGVKVRLLLDSFGAVHAPHDDLDAMKAAGVQVQSFRDARFGRFTRFHRRNHCRAIVIDGRVGYTGGAAVADKWLGDARDEREWRDDMFRVTGPLATSLQSVFAQLWTGSRGEMLAGDDVYPQVSPDGSKVVHVSLASAPVHERHPLRILYGLSFLAARQRLFIASSYFTPDKHTRGFVTERARAGVDVRLLVPGDKTDALPIRQATHSYVDELLASGVHVYEFQPTMMHSKYVVIDGKWSVVGSANMDVRSKELNNENVLGILDEGLARDLERAFRSDLARAKELRLDEWRRRGLLKRFLERFCVLFVEQY